MTSDLYLKLSGIKLFSRLGLENPEENVLQVSSWSVAMESYNKSWKNIRESGINRLSSRLLKEDLDLLLLRHDLVEYLTPLIKELVKRPVEEIGQEMTPEIISIIELDLIHACVEDFFKDRVPPGLYTESIKWYFKGHFPCGWQWYEKPKPGWLLSELKNLGTFIIY
jgi:hypothetical protein